MSWAVSFFFSAAPSSSISRNVHVHSDITSYQLVEGSNHFNFPFRAIFESQQAPWVKVALETEDEIDEDLLTTASFERGYSVLGHQLNSVYLYRRMWAQCCKFRKQFPNHHMVMPGTD